MGRSPIRQLDQYTNPLDPALIQEVRIQLDIHPIRPAGRRHCSHIYNGLALSTGKLIIADKNKTTVDIQGNTGN